MTAQDIRDCHDIIKGSARAAGNDTLVYIDLSAADFGIQIHGSSLDLAVGHFLILVHDIRGIFQQFPDGHGIAGMHGQSDRRLDCAEIHVYAAVIIGDRGGLQLPISLRTSVDREISFCLFIRHPDRGPAGGLCRHDIDPVPVLNGQAGNAGAHKFHDFIFDITIGIGSADQRQRHIMRAYTGAGAAGQINGYHTGTGHVIGASHQLFGQLSAAFSYRQGTQSPVAGMGIGTQDHAAAACHQFPVDGMDDGHIGGYINAAVFMGCRKSEFVVILIDGAADGAQGVVAVGQDIGHGKFLHAGGPGGLDNAHISDIMAGQRIITHPQMVHILCCIMRFQDPVCDRPFRRLLPGDRPAGRGCRFRRVCHKLCSVHQIYAAFIKLDHIFCSAFLCFIYSPARCLRASIPAFRQGCRSDIGLYTGIHPTIIHKKTGIAYS